MKNRRLIAAVAVLAGACALGWSALGLGSPRSERVKLVEVPTPPAPVTVVHNLARGETLSDVLETYGLSGNQIFEIVEAMREYESPRRLRSGTEVRLVMRPSEAPARISLKLDRDRTLHLLAAPGGSTRWSALLDSVEIVRDTILLAGRIETNLFEAEMSGDVDRLASGERVDIALRLSRIFAWQIDFWRDIRTNDAYRLVVAREVRPDGTVRSASVLAAEFRNNGRLLSAIRFQSDSIGPVEYYDEEGEALRGQFLLSPLDLARVTSGFNLRRFHPILKRRRPHLGVDYGASRGTPVKATGAGIVTRAGPWGGYGTAIEIRHPNNLRTRYAHLSGITRGVRAGVRVEQGAVIGYVGSSGLATAAHLHYEFLQNGAQVNPARLDLPKAEPVPDELRDVFAAMRESALARLQLVPMPGLAAEAAARRTQD